MTITLSQAMKLCKIRDDETVYLRKRGQNRAWADAYSGKQIRNKFDMKAVKVCGIDAKFSWGEWCGMEFEIL